MSHPLWDHGDMSKAHEIVRTGMRLAEFFRRFPDDRRLRCGSCLAAGRAVRSVRTVGVAGCRRWRRGVRCRTGAASVASISR